MIKQRRNTSLKMAIWSCGLPQADVATAASMSESRLSRIVNGRSRPHDYERKNLAHALDMSQEDLPV